MTEESLLLVRELKVQIRRIFDEYEKIEKRNEELQQVLLSLENKVRFLEEENGSLIKKYENLKLAKAIESGTGDSLAARRKIGNIMREIDKCVALLNG